MTRRLVDEAACLELGAELALRLVAGDIVALSGPLGVGKSTLARGILRSLGWQEAVPSPTFSLIVEYPLDPPVAHLDLYRLETPPGADFGEAIQGRIALVEWPERWPGLVAEGRLFSVALSFAGNARKAVVDERG